MYKCVYFKIEELVSPKVYNSVANKELLWLLFDERLLKTIDAIRNYLNEPIAINTWHSKGDREQCGFRDDINTGALLSQHRYGRAVDMLIKSVSGATGYNALRQKIIANKDKFPYIKGLENNINWLHVDVGNRGENILLFNP